MFRPRSYRHATQTPHPPHSAFRIPPPALLCAFLVACSGPARGTVLWTDLGATLVHDSGAGSDILGGAVKRDDSASDTLYFRFHVDPLSDAGTEEYFAGFQLYEGQTERLGVGNSQGAWAYSVYKAAETGEMNKFFGDIDLKSLRRESSAPGVFLPYELPRRGIECTIVFKVQYVVGGDDLVTVWLNPDLGPGATEAGEAEGMTTRFKANASFNEIHLRHGGGGGGWTFSDMAIATAFGDFVSGSVPGAGGTGRSGLPLSFQVWQRAQGLPQESVRALAQTREGYLWIGNDDGLVRFDGVRFVSFGLREGVRGGPVRVLFEDSAGALWIGTAGGGLARWRGGESASFTTQDGLPSDSITALAEDNEGRLWVGTDAGLAVRQADKFRPLNGAEELRGRPITALHKDRQSKRGTMWVCATGAGVFGCTGTTLTRLGDDSVESLLQDPHCLLASAGRIWVGAGDDFVLCQERGEWRRYRIARHLARPFVSTLAEEPDGTVWAGSVSEGLFEFRAGKLRAINASSGLSDNFVESLLVDREGNLWVGTAGGLNRLRHSNLTVLGQNAGLGYGPVRGLAEVSPGIVWAAKPDDGLYGWDGRSFGRLVSEEWSRRYREVNALLLSREGVCWVAEGHGLFRVQGTDSERERQALSPRPPPLRPASEPELAALAGLNVLALCEDAQGDLWAGTREGELWRLRGKSWKRQTNSLLGRAITTIAPGADGSVWVGTDGAGLFWLERDSAAQVARREAGDPVRVREHFDKRRGLLSNSIRTLYSDREGTLWIGTVSGGLGRWHQGRLTAFTAREGLPDNTISQILEDGSNRLWLGCNRGIACVARSELDELAAGKVTAVYPQVYGRSEGMASEECTGGFHPAGLRSKSGLLWFPTLKGIVVADPRAEATNAPPPNVVLEEMLVDGVAVRNEAAAGMGEMASGSSAHKAAHPATRSEGRSASATGFSPALPVVRLGPGKHRLEFHYTGLSFSAPERMRFRYRLEGLDPDWVDAGLQRTASYGYVPPGQYRFRVTARDSEGAWNQTDASLALTVLPHFWQARWVWVLAMVGLVVSAGGVVRLVEKKRHQRHLKDLEQERTLERERARIAQDLHDDLGSSLTRISLLSDLVKADKDNPSQVEAQAAKISHSAMHTVRALEEIVWALRPGSDSLQSLIEYIAHSANELFEGDTARCRLDLPAELPARSLPPETRHNIFLIVKEALTNALKHASAREVRVQAKPRGSSLEIVVQDDGKGFDTRANPAGPGRRHGLGNMRRRADGMGARLEIESVRAKGTTVRLIVPLPGAA